ncbi:stability/partitioning determinant [Methylorubrum sp. SB2]|uniref:stability/partitioning determinant n=1 Tax=Methylorubrum subtropicum TaxID=3138812 RepID=UPI00313EB413
MNTKERAPLGFEDELNDFDPAAFAKPKRAANDKPKPEEAKKAAEAAGFRSREPVKAPVVPEEPAAPPRRRRTGRNAQINIKTRAETIEAFTRIADANGWGLGETFERAIELLTREHPTK